MCVIVGKCGGLWGAVLWIGGGVGEREIFSVVGWGQMWGIVTVGKYFRLWDVGILGCTDCGVCKFSQILTFSKKI